MKKSTGEIPWIALCARSALKREAGVVKVTPVLDLSVLTIETNRCVHQRLGHEGCGKDQEEG